MQSAAKRRRLVFKQKAEHFDRPKPENNDLIIVEPQAGTISSYLCYSFVFLLYSASHAFAQQFLFGSAYNCINSIARFGSQGFLCF